MDKQYYKPAGLTDQGHGYAPSYGRGRGGAKPPKKICTFYLDGACKKGQGCDFYHPKNPQKYKTGGPGGSGATGFGNAMGAP
jgi:hypothetical protein